MVFNPFLENPYIWIFFSALFFGMAVSRISRFSARAKEPEKARNRKWVFAYLYLSLAILFAVLGVFIPGSEKILDINLLIFFLVLSGIFTLAFRFKKAFGLPFLFLFVAFVIILLLFIQSLIAFSGETEIAQLRITSLQNDTIKGELVLADGKLEYFELEGSYLGVDVDVVIFDDFLVFFGAKTWYRFLGISSFVRDEDTQMHVQMGNYPLQHQPGISQELYKLFESNEQLFPGIKSVQGDLIIKKVKFMQTYSIRVQNDGGVEVIAVE